MVKACLSLCKTLQCLSGVSCKELGTGWGRGHAWLRCGADQRSCCAQVQKQGHLSDDAASHKELHNLADRFHTVLKNPIDTGRLASARVRPHLSPHVTGMSIVFLRECIASLHAAKEGKGLMLHLYCPGCHGVCSLRLSLVPHAHMHRCLNPCRLVLLQTPALPQRSASPQRASPVGTALPQAATWTPLLLWKVALRSPP